MEKFPLVGNVCSKITDFTRAKGKFIAKIDASNRQTKNMQINR